MNKAFVREPEFDGRAYCPRCGTLGIAVLKPTLDAHLKEASRARIGDSAWFCEFARCAVVYFDQFERFAEVDDLTSPIFPKDARAPICACFGFTVEDVEADVQQGTPTRIRQLLARSKSSEAQCLTRAADGQCCMRQVQRLYMRRVAEK